MLIHMNSVQWLRLLRIPETVYRQSHAKRTQSLPCIQPCTTYHAAKKKSVTSRHCLPSITILTATAGMPNYERGVLREFGRSTFRTKSCILVQSQSGSIN
jgi:hypothetical protein